MFIAFLKELVTNIAVMIVFMSAVEMIAPDNKMKKYVSFVLGIMLIAVLLNPVIKLLKNSENGIEQTISQYEKEVNSFDNYADSKNVFASQNENSSNDDTAFSESFKKNLENEIKKELEKKFENNDFEVNIDCVVNKSEMTCDIKEVDVNVYESGVRKVETISINNDVKKKEENSDEYSSVVSYLKDTLNISSEKIKIYKM